MKYNLLISLMVILFASIALGGDICKEDLVKPKEWDDGFPYDGEWFSGYLNATESGTSATMKVHYFFFPSDLK